MNKPIITYTGSLDLGALIGVILGLWIGWWGVAVIIAWHTFWYTLARLGVIGKE